MNESCFKRQTTSLLIWFTLKAFTPDQILDKDTRTIISTINSRLSFKIKILVALGLFCLVSQLCSAECTFFEGHPNGVINHLAENSCVLNLGLSEISLRQLNELFNTLIEEVKLPYEYICTGCVHRAHKVTEIFLAKNNFELGKIFLTSTDEDTPLSAQNPRNKNEIVTWQHHVAAVALVNANNGKKLIYVLDPAVNRNHPLLLEEWVKNISTLTKHIHIQIDNRYRLITEFSCNDLSASQKIICFKGFSESANEVLSQHQKTLSTTPVINCHSDM